jgi:hypothetical protein
MKNFVFATATVLLVPTTGAYADPPPETPPLQVIYGPQPIAPMPNNPLANIPAPITPGMIQASEVAHAPAPTGPVAYVGDKVGLVPTNIPADATVIHIKSEKVSQPKDHVSKNGIASVKSKVTQSEIKKDPQKKTAGLGNKVPKPTKIK